MSEKTFVAASGNHVHTRDDADRRARGRSRCSSATRSCPRWQQTPSEPNTVYAGGKPATLFVSHNSGQTWTELTMLVRHIPNRWWWFSPAETDVLLAGVEFGAVVRSEDGGHIWSRHRSGALRNCHSLNFHVADGN